jgi:choline dehydrogenase-like flavoprotein
MAPFPAARPHCRIEPTMATTTEADSFDYIVVGAGSAGCVLANRLTASGRDRVLLLEAGGHDRHLWIHIPLGYGKLFADARVNWLYKTEPEPELNNRQVIQPRGKVLGGSSSINGLLYLRGQPEDYDHWRQLGNAGWSFDDVLPYFRRSEDQERGADALHGVGGPLSVSNVCEPHPLCDAFIESAQQAGFPRNDDFNGPTQEGAGYFQLTAKNGRRWSTVMGYLRQARGRKNLRIETNALASRILFSGKRAVGVEYRQGETTRVAHATCEVILAGGAFNSPQLLQLSGLGPATLLRQHGIDVLADLPGVGADLQDHLQVRIQYRCSEPITMNDVINSWRHSTLAGLRYLMFRKGLLAIGAGYAGGFFRTSPLHHLQRRDLGRRAAPVPGLHRLGLPAPAGKPRLRAHQVGRPAPGAGDPAALSLEPIRPRRHRGRVEAAAADHDPAGDAPLHRGRARARPERHQRRGPAGVRALRRDHGVPPDQHLPHGTGRHRGGRRPAARARLRGFARRRCLDHADGGVGQHQRRGGDDRREGRGHDFAGCGCICRCSTGRGVTLMLRSRAKARRLEAWPHSGS